MSNKITFTYCNGRSDEIDFDSIITHIEESEKEFYVLNVSGHKFYIMLVNDVYIESGVNDFMTGEVRYQEAGVWIGYEDIDYRMLSWEGKWIK